MCWSIRRLALTGNTSAFVAAAAASWNINKREPVLLRHGEKLNGRYSALAMDCSTSAAENHLRAAEESLRLVAAGDFDVMLRKMIDAYMHLTPEAEQLKPTVNRVVLQQVLVRRWIRWAWWLAQLAILAALGSGADGNSFRAFKPDGKCSWLGFITFFCSLC